MKTFRITFSNSGGPLETLLVTAEAESIQWTAGERVMDMIRESGCCLCSGDTITVEEVE